MKQVKTNSPYSPLILFFLGLVWIAIEGPTSVQAQTGITRLITDPAGNAEIWEYQKNLGVHKLLSKTSSVDGKGVMNQYDATNNLISRTDAEGRITSYTYNNTNQRTSMTEASGTAQARTTFYEYYSADIDLITKVTEPSVYAAGSKETITFFDKQLNPLSVTINGYQPNGVAIGRTTEYNYNTLGQLVHIDGPRTDVSDYITLSYNMCSTGGSCGQLASIIDAQNNMITFDAYDASGLLLKMTDLNGTTTSYTYDVRQRVEGITVSSSSGTRITTYTYDGVGQVTKVVMPDGLVINNTYNNARYLEAVEDNQGNRIEYNYDLKGNRTHAQAKDSFGKLQRIVTTAFDHRDRVSQFNAAGSIAQMVKDAVGNITAQIDPNMNPATGHTYDALNRHKLYIDATGGSTAYSYDVQDQLVQVATPNGATTRYQYDDLGNLLSETSPDRGLSIYTHDGAGNVLTKTDARGLTVTYRYDLLNRLLGVTYPGGQENVTIVYDVCSEGVGRPCEIYDDAGTTTFNYDSYGNVLSESRLQDGISYLTSYTYDNANRVLSMTYPNGRIVTVQRDSLGRASALDSMLGNTLQSIVHSRKFRADGLLLSQMFGNGIAETRNYDLQGRLIAKMISDHEPTSYTYDQNGNLLNILRVESPVSYEYDALNRLESGEIEREIDGAITHAVSTWRYDGNGNRLSQTLGVATKSYRYTPSTNQLMQRGNKAYVLDAMGNTLSDKNGKRFFEYNEAGRLVRFTKNGALKAEYAYNAQNQRIKKVLHKKPDKFGSTVSHTFLYFYDLNGMLISEFKNGEPSRDYVWADGIPVQQDVVKLSKTGETIVENSLSLITDHLNTPRVAVDESKTIVWTWRSNGFGEGGVNKDPDGDGIEHNLRLRFPGQFSDPESGLYYNWNRYYDPQTGRYITSDPIGLMGGVNTYGYALQNPVYWIDKAGSDVITFSLGFGVSKDIAGYFGIEGRGIDIGGGVSFPGLTGGKFDIGVVGTIHGGGDDIGIARIRGSINFNEGSFSDLAGLGAEINGTLIDKGFQLSLDDEGNVSGIGFHRGAGLQIGGSGTVSGIISLREGLKGYKGQNSGCE